MKLILMRHGDAGAYTQPDSERALTPIGVAQSASTGAQLIERLLALESPIDLAVTSPLLRARQTLDVVGDEMKRVGWKPVRMINDAFVPSGNPMAALDWLSKQPARCILVVCHMPIIAAMAGILTDQEPQDFALAEAQLFEQPIIVPGLSKAAPPIYPEPGL